jgi:hypothetical protein
VFKVPIVSLAQKPVKNPLFSSVEMFILGDSKFGI